MTDGRRALIVAFPESDAVWDLHHGVWASLPTPLAGWEGSTPNVEEWAEFWRREPRDAILIDARDLAFEGEQAREPDWSFRAMRWARERGTHPPTPSDLPSSYVLHASEEGWGLSDQVMGRLVMIVRQGDHEPAG